MLTKQTDVLRVTEKRLVLYVSRCLELWNEQCGDFPLLPHKLVLRLASADTKRFASAEIQSLCEVSLLWLPEQGGGRLSLHVQTY